MLNTKFCPVLCNNHIYCQSMTLSKCNRSKSCKNSGILCGLYIQLFDYLWSILVLDAVKLIMVHKSLVNLHFRKQKKKTKNWINLDLCPNRLQDKIQKWKYQFQKKKIRKMNGIWFVFFSQSEFHFECNISFSPSGELLFASYLLHCFFFSSEFFPATVHSAKWKEDYKPYSYTYWLKKVNKKKTICFIL